MLNCVTALGRTAELTMSTSHDLSQSTQRQIVCSTCRHAAHVTAELTICPHCIRYPAITALYALITTMPFIRPRQTAWCQYKDATHRPIERPSLHAQDESCNEAWHFDRYVVYYSVYCTHWNTVKFTAIHNSDFFVPYDGDILIVFLCL